MMGVFDPQNLPKVLKFPYRQPLWGSTQEMICHLDLPYSLPCPHWSKGLMRLCKLIICLSGLAVGTVPPRSEQVALNYDQL